MSYSFRVHMVTRNPIRLSSFTRKAFLEKLDFSRPGVFVLIGVAVSLISDVLERMSPTSRLLLIGEYKKEGVGDSDQLVFERGEGENVFEKHRIESITGVVVDGSTFVLQKEMLERLKKLLRPEGVFLAYGHDSNLEAVLSQQFSEYSRGRVWKNLPPIRLGIARRPVFKPGA